jgi:tetratricopeptide (TPR) repeat protein
VRHARRLVVALAGWAIALGPAVAQAQGARPGTSLDPARRAEAKRHFDRGADLYAQGAYEEAIAEWMRSYEISQHPLIFESVANAQERLGRPREAREALARWREAAPPEEHELLDRRLRNLDERIARLEAEERAAAEVRAREEDEAARAAAATRGPGGAEAGGAGSPLVPIGFVVGGVGATAIVAGLVVGAVAAGERPDEASVCRAGGEGSLCQETARDAIETSSSLALAADLVWIGGALAAATGVVLVVVGSSDQAPEGDVRASLAPSVAPGGGGATLRGTF